MSDQMVFILDDNAEFRESTAFLLEAMGYAVDHSGDYDDALSAMMQIKKEQAACLLLDIRMPEISGLDVHDVMHERGIDLPVIYMTAHGDVPLAVTAMRKGALTFLEKPLEDEALQSALEQALSDKIQGQRTSAEERAVVADARERFQSLSSREHEVANGVARELSNKEIAGELGVSIKTVEMHRSHVMKKLAAKNAAHLIRLLRICENDQARNAQDLRL